MQAVNVRFAWLRNRVSVVTSPAQVGLPSIALKVTVNVEFYDVREGLTIFSSHKTLHQACLVQQEAPIRRQVVLTTLDGTKWLDLREYSPAECREVAQGAAAERPRRSNRFQKHYPETRMIADRLRALREHKNMSQGDMEKRTGLLRCYISRVENGHTVPAIETLEKMAQALEVPLYVLFYDGEKPPKPNIPMNGVATGWGSSGRDAKTLHRLRQLMSRADKDDVKLLLFMAQKMSRKKKRNART